MSWEIGLDLKSRVFEGGHTEIKGDGEKRWRETFRWEK
jgi:hypothetical protein